MNLFTDIPLQSGHDAVFHAIIEIPKHSCVKYEYNEKHGAMFVDRIFKTPVLYPQNYGFFPQTWNKFDNDPMDVIVISSQTFHPGVIVPVRLVGIIEMEDTGELDHKILAIPKDDPFYNHCKDLTDIESETIANIEWFLSHYKDRNKGKKITLLGTKNAKKAIEFLEECSAEYKTYHKNA